MWKGKTKTKQKLLNAQPAPAGMKQDGDDKGQSQEACVMCLRKNQDPQRWTKKDAFRWFQQKSNPKSGPDKRQTDKRRTGLAVAVPQSFVDLNPTAIQNNLHPKLEAMHSSKMHEQYGSHIPMMDVSRLHRNPLADFSQKLTKEGPLGKRGSQQNQLANGSQRKVRRYNVAPNTVMGCSSSQARSNFHLLCTLQAGRYVSGGSRLMPILQGCSTLRR